MYKTLTFISLLPIIIINGKSEKEFETFRQFEQNFLLNHLKFLEKTVRTHTFGTFYIINKKTAINQSPKLTRKRRNINAFTYPCKVLGTYHTLYENIVVTRYNYNT